MTQPIPGSILFCCDYNSVRSPMAEGIMKRMHGNETYVQSAGVRSDKDIDGFSITVCTEIGVELSRHRSRSFDDMEEWGDEIGSYDLIIALTPASQRRALEYTRVYSLEVLYWPIMDPSGFGDDRQARLIEFRKARDEIVDRIQAEFGEGQGVG